MEGFHYQNLIVIVYFQLLTDMKTLNYTIAIGLGIFSLVRFFTAYDILFAFIILLLCIIFFLFGLMEEKNEQIDRLHNIIRGKKN